MESFFSRYRNALVLLALLVAQIIGLAVQVRRTDSGHINLDPRDGSGVRLLRLWANAVVSPPERAVQGSKTGAFGIWQNYFDLRHVRRQNMDLQSTIDRLRLEQAALLEDARQGERLQALMNFQQKYLYSTVPAQIIGSSGSDQSRIFYLDKGRNAGIAPEMAVVTPDGIVGKIREVYPRSAQVLAINDQTSGAGVILETTRIRGILRGNAAGQVQVVGILADQRIKPGENVLTAGGDEIFPRGLPVGVIDKVMRDPERDAFVDILVKPAAHIESLDEVLVITSTQPRFSPQQQRDMDTSETLKGAEAAEAAEKKKAAEIMAERLPGLIDPNLPFDQQPLHDTSSPNPVARPAMPLHPDRFTPGAQDVTGSSAQPQNAVPAKPRSADSVVSRPVAEKPLQSKPHAPQDSSANPTTPGTPAKSKSTTPPSDPQRNP